MDKTIVQKVVIPAPVQKVFEALTDPEITSRFTGAKAEIRLEPGAPFNVYNGDISGFNIKVIPPERITQFWRKQSETWPKGHLSRVDIHLVSKHHQTELTLTHSGVPQDEYASLVDYWNTRYWGPLTNMLKKN